MQTRVDPSKLTGSEIDVSGGSFSGPIDFEQLLGAARRQARVVVGISLAGLLLGFIYVVTAVPEYTAKTDLLIDSQKDKNELSNSIAELTFDTGAIDSQVEVLKSEKIALAVVDALKLTHDPDFMGSQGSMFSKAIGVLRGVFNVSNWFVSREKSDSESEAALRRSAVSQLKTNLDVRRVAHTYVLAIQYTSRDPGKASSVANAFADAYLTEQLDAKFDATRRAAGWLQTRIAELKQQSLDSDHAIQKFKADHGIVQTGGDKPGLISDQQLSQLNEQMVTASGETAKAEARYSQIQDLLNSGRVGIAVPDSLSNPVINELRTKFLNASKMESQLESKLGPGHFQVIALKREMDEYNRLIFEELQRTAESYRSEAEVARAKEKSLALSMSGLVGQSALTNQTLVQLRELERESDTYRTLYQTFMQRYQEALQQQSFPITEARVITAANPPSVPTYPKRPLILALSLVFGAMVGSGVAAVREYRDRVFRVASHVRDELGLELLGMLEAVGSTGPIKASEETDPTHIRPNASIQRYALDHPLSSFSETLRSAKVAVDLALGERRPKIVGVISVLPNEGKSTVSKNFASLLAHLGAPTLLIDGDLRNPGLTRGIGRHASSGLLEALRGDTPLAQHLLLEPDSGLSVLPAVVKKRVTQSSEIISSPAMRKLLSSAGQQFDYIIIDLPPLGPVVDVRAAASLFDAFLFVTEWGRTPRAIVHNLLAADETLYEKCVGVIFNKVNLKRVNLYEGYGSKDYYYGRYGKYYQREKA